MTSFTSHALVPLSDKLTIAAARRLRVRMNLQAVSAKALMPLRLGGPP